MIIYGELVLIQCPRGYQPRALPLRHPRLFVFPWHVSIMWPPAHKAITIFKFGHLHVLVVDDGVLRRASAALQGILLCFRRRLAMTSSFCKATEWFGYRQLALIEWPRSYEPRALAAAPCRFQWAASVKLLKDFIYPNNFWSFVFWFVWRGKFTSTATGFELMTLHCTACHHLVVRSKNCGLPTRLYAAFAIAAWNESIQMCIWRWR